MAPHGTCTCVTCPVHGAGKRERLSPQRVAGRTAFAEFLREYIVAAGRRGLSLVPAWASHVGVDESTWRHWANPLRLHSVVGAGDLSALEPTDLLALLEAWCERLRAALAPAAPAGDPRLLIVSLLDGAGDVAKSIRKAMHARSRGGERVTATEWADIAARLHELGTLVRDAERAANAAGALARGAT